MTGLPKDSRDRVFPGLRLGLPAGAGWRSGDPGVGTVNVDGFFHARDSGTAAVSASGTEFQVSVLGELVRVTGSVERLVLAGADACGRFEILGYDACGYGATIEPGDVELDYDTSLLAITPDAGGFAVAARAGWAAALVTATVAGHTTTVGVTVGLRHNKITDFEGWRFSAARATGSASTAEARTGTGLALEYDFTQSTATRAAYAAPPTPITVAGQARSFTLWIKGRGDGEWPSLELIDGTGAAVVLRGEPVTWRGWRHLDMPVPPGTTYPLAVRRFYVAQPNPAVSHMGGVVVADLAARLPPELDLPAGPMVADPLVTPTVAARGWRFAVMSDAQFVAREPDSEIVASARRTLREIKTARPDFLIVNGDLVDEGGPADLAFARQILTEELGDTLPWHYLPGNHEVMGGTIDGFIAEFGDPADGFDHKGTRFITLNTSGLALGREQLMLLRKRLDAAAGDMSVDSVMVVAHVPPRDPMPQAASRLVDREEAATVEACLSSFGRDTGKGVGFIGGHVGTFAAWRIDGVPYLVNGNSGKDPAAAPGLGGFIGWTEFGVDPIGTAEQRARRDNPYRRPPSNWLTAQIRPQIDTLRLTGPGIVPAGYRVTVEASLTQQGRTVPLAHPVSADWAASRGVYVAETPPEAGRQYHAWFRPRTGELTGFKPGEIVLAVTVNGVCARLAVSVAG